MRYLLLLLIVFTFIGFGTIKEQSNRPYYRWIDPDRKRAITYPFQVPEGVEVYAVLDTKGLDSVIVFMYAQCGDPNLKRISNY